MLKQIPAPLIAAFSEIAAARETHASIDNLFVYAGAPGDPPQGSKRDKSLSWLRRVNAMKSVDPLAIMGKLLEAYMEEAPPTGSHLDDFPARTQTEDQVRLSDCLARYDLQYVRGGRIVPALASPTRTLDVFLRDN